MLSILYLVNVSIMERNTNKMTEFIYAINDLNASSMLGGKRRLYSTLGQAKGALKIMQSKDLENKHGYKDLIIVRYKFDGFE